MSWHQGVYEVQLTGQSGVRPLQRYAEGHVHPASLGLLLKTRTEFFFGNLYNAQASMLSGEAEK